MRNYLLALVILYCESCNHFAGKGDADEYAREWVMANIPISLHPRYQCMNLDTDSNGYVSCTVTYDSVDGNVELLPIECGVNRVSDGCEVEGCKPLAGYMMPRRRQ